MMSAKVTVTCDTGSGTDMSGLRTFVCRMAKNEFDDDYNPLPEFNEVLDVVLQQAFDAGREYGKKEKK